MLSTCVDVINLIWYLDITASWCLLWGKSSTGGAPVKDGGSPRHLLPALDLTSQPPFVKPRTLKPCGQQVHCHTVSMEDTNATIYPLHVTTSNTKPIDISFSAGGLIGGSTFNVVYSLLKIQFLAICLFLKSFPKNGAQPSKPGG